jgi:hypothetical protein
MKEALSSSETPVLTRATRRNIQEDSNLHKKHLNSSRYYVFHCYQTDLKIWTVSIYFNYFFWIQVFENWQWKGLYALIISYCHTFNKSKSACFRCLQNVIDSFDLAGITGSAHTNNLTRQLRRIMKLNIHRNRDDPTQCQMPDSIPVNITAWIKNKTNSMALSPQANYTDWATATCQRNLVPTFVDRGASHGQHRTIPTVVNLSILDRSRYFSFK